MEPNPNKGGSQTVQSITVLLAGGHFEYCSASHALGAHTDVYFIELFPHLCNGAKVLNKHPTPLIFVSLFVSYRVY